VLLALALALAACDDGTGPIGPVGPGTPVPTVTPAPTETPVSIGGTGAELYQQAHAAMMGRKSYRFVNDTDLGRGATQHIEGVWVAPHTISMVVVTTGTTGAGTQYICRVADRHWVRPNEADAWAAVNPAPRAATSPDQVAAILRFAQSLDLVGNEPLTRDGQTVNATHLKFILDAGRLAAANIGIAKGSGDLWIDPTSKHILQMKLTFTSSVQAARGEATSTLTLSKFDDPSNTANCPA
jgi:hypothetical protein